MFLGLSPDSSPWQQALHHLMSSPLPAFLALSPIPWHEQAEFFYSKHLDKPSCLQFLPLPTLVLLPSQFPIYLCILVCIIFPPEALTYPLPSSHSPNKHFVFFLHALITYPYHSTYSSVLELLFYFQLSPLGCKFLKVKDVETYGSWNIVYAWKVFLDCVNELLWLLLTLFMVVLPVSSCVAYFPQFQNLF